MLAVIHGLTRHRFHVAFEWGRLAQLAVVLGGLAAAGDVLLPGHGLAGFALRALVWVAIAPVLWLTGFVSPSERRHGRALLTRVRVGGWIGGTH